MDIMIFFLIAIILIIGIPIGISYFIYNWFKKNGYDKRFNLLAFIPILIVGYFIYDAIYPSTDFYKTDFKEVTNMRFPESGIIKYKTATFPDHFGDYTSSFLAEFNKSDLQKIEEQLKNVGFEEKKNDLSSNELDYIERKKGRRNYTKEYNRQQKYGKHYFVGFLDDNKSIIITRVSW